MDGESTGVSARAAGEGAFVAPRSPVERGLHISPGRRRAGQRTARVRHPFRSCRCAAGALPRYGVDRSAQLRQAQGPSSGDEAGRSGRVERRDADLRGGRRTSGTSRVADEPSGQQAGVPHRRPQRPRRTGAALHGRLPERAGLLRCANGGPRVEPHHVPRHRPRGSVPREERGDAGGQQPDDHVGARVRAWRGRRSIVRLSAAHRRSRHPGLQLPQPRHAAGAAVRRSHRARQPPAPELVGRQVRREHRLLRSRREIERRRVRRSRTEERRTRQPDSRRDRRQYRLSGDAVPQAHRPLRAALRCVLPRRHDGRRFRDTVGHGHQRRGRRLRVQAPRLLRDCERRRVPAYEVDVVGNGRRLRRGCAHVHEVRHRAVEGFRLQDI